MKRALLLDLSGPLAEAVAVAQAAESAGIDAVYAIEGGREAFVPLAAMAVGTATIGLGSYVANAYARSPWLTAISALDLDELSGGRFVLGLGTGNRHINDWSHGLDSSRPLAKMRDYVPLVRAVVAARAGELVARDGPVHRTHWRAGRDPLRPAVPVVVAAAGPRMIELAGGLADGVGVGVLVSPEHLRDVIRPLARDAAAAAGRDPERAALPDGGDGQRRRRRGAGPARPPGTPSAGCSTRCPTRTTTSCCAPRASPPLPTSPPSSSRKDGCARRWRRSTTRSSTA